jgi:hypothetical protein
MNIEQKIELLKSKLDYWENYIPVNNMGKWSTKIRIDSIKEKIEILNSGIDIEIDDLTIDKLEL